MPRPRRVHVPGGLYHAVLRGNHRQPIFDGGDDYLRFEEIVARAVDRHGASLLAYCWMTNHVHLAIRIDEVPLGAVMGIVASRYARAKQRSVPTTGHLFERRYRARLVDADRHLLALVHYIHMNPVRAGMVTDPRDYRWSSHRAYLGAPHPDWLSIGPVLGMLATSTEAARATYARFMGETPAATDREDLSPNVRPVRTLSAEVGRPARLAAGGGSVGPRSLEAIAMDIARSRGLRMEDLRSKRRYGDWVRARAEIARCALLEGAANLSQVARYLNRSPTTLSALLHRRR